VTIRLANDESIFDVAKLVGTSLAMIDQTYGHIYRQKQQLPPITSLLFFTEPEKAMSGG